jgi:signal transduction histidine kinase
VASHVAATATVLCAAATVLVAVANGTAPAQWLDGNQASQWLGGLGFGLVGALVLRAQPGGLLGPLCAGAGVAALVSALGLQVAEYAGTETALGAVAAWAGAVLWLPCFVTLLVGVPLLFPDGRLPSPRWRPVALVAVGAGAFAVLSFATTQEALDDSGFPELHNPVDLPVPDTAQLAVGSIAFVVCLGVGVAALVSLLLRLRRSRPPRRAQYAWFVTSMLLAVVAGFAPVADWLALLVNVASFAALAVGIVRHNLFDIELVLSRTVVYLTLTGLALTAYFVAVAALGSGSSGGAVPALVTAVVALVLAGGRQRLQQAVDRLMYGERDQARALAGLGDRLASALDPDEVVPATVEAVRTSFRLPYAQLTIAGEGHAAYTSGERPASTVAFPLAHAGDTVGVLEIGLRRGERALSADDRARIEGFARQAAVAVHGVRASREVRRSRERIVLAREEERSRIRRDLHDGLGPALAGISLGLETAGRAVAPGSPGAARLLDELRSDTAACVDDIRRIVADLRPPALDGDGLHSALRAHAEHLTSRSGGTLHVCVADGSPLRGLPAAVEVAVYRIATEAMTNAARHARATCCRITCHLDPARGRLHLEVEDDGTGAAPAAPGNGLVSMRERAEELGGTCVVTFRAGRGTRVCADLPSVGAVAP